MNSKPKPLGHTIADALDAYFAALEGDGTDGLYDLVMLEVEKPLFERVMRYAEGNQSKAARYLGISRGTLRKKLQQYNLD